MISTRVRGTRGEDLGTSGSTVRKFTQAGETCRTIHTCALVQTGAGPAFVDVHLAEVTSEALPTLAGEAVQLVNARARILARTWQTIIPV